MEARTEDLQGVPRQQDASFTSTSTRLWLPPEAPRFPAVGEGAGAPQECVCLCHQAHRAHGSSPGTPWPGGMLCQLCLLSWPSFSSDQSCFVPAVQKRQMSSLSWLLLQVQELAQIWLLQEPGAGGLVLLVESKGSWPPPLCPGCTLLQYSLLPTPLL